ncbi:hypothetical protein HDU85_004752 [Gaertneriomyces sp. JEL0708]|nr:hypothetical protein HDU85_004752 [Gaertneriomyces sp. JEL0708]
MRTFILDPTARGASTPNPLMTAASIISDCGTEYFTPMPFPPTPSVGTAASGFPSSQPLQPLPSTAATPRRDLHQPPTVADRTFITAFSSAGSIPSTPSIAARPPRIPTGAAVPSLPSNITQPIESPLPRKQPPPDTLHLKMPTTAISAFNMSLPATPRPIMSCTTTACATPTVFDASEVAGLLKRVDTNADAEPPIALLLDMRSFAQYSRHRIKLSVNVTVPTTLLKRPTFGANKLFETLGSDYAKAVFQNWTNYPNIIIYDADTTSPSPSSPLVLLSGKLLKDHPSARIGYLRGGLTEFAASYPDLCESVPPPEGSKGIGVSVPTTTQAGDSANGAGLTLAGMGFGHTATGATPKSRLNLSLDLTGLGPLTAPSALGALACSRPLQQQQQQPTYAAHKSVDISSSPDNLLEQYISSPDATNHVPVFVRQLVREGNVKDALHRNFQAIESAEQKRLDCAFRAQCRTDPFSVSDALEAGATRNRYNNIWPYNHNRVRLSRRENDTGSSDYVNASHVLSPAGHRRYIATQGPTPSTFDDFWRMVYEQDSRLILMLCADADIQRGSQTCHKYWPDEHTSGRTMTMNSMVVSFENEESVSFAGDSGDIVIRAFSIAPVTAKSISSAATEMEGRKTVYQVQYLGWPDHGVPAHPDEMLRVHHVVNQLLARVGEASPELPSNLQQPGTGGQVDPSGRGTGPMIVHCSAGVGRTGAFICVDAVLAVCKTCGLPTMASPVHDGLDENSTPTTTTPNTCAGTGTASHPSWSQVSSILHPPLFHPSFTNDMILASVHHLRSQRVLMVQSFRQFVFCYEVVGRWGAIWNQNCTLSEEDGDGRPLVFGGKEYASIIGGLSVENVLEQMIPRISSTSDGSPVIESKKRERGTSWDEISALHGSTARESKMGRPA